MSFLRAALKKKNEKQKTNGTNDKPNEPSQNFNPGKKFSIEKEMSFPRITFL